MTTTKTHSAKQAAKNEKNYVLITHTHPLSLARARNSSLPPPSPSLSPPPPPTPPKKDNNNNSKLKNENKNHRHQQSTSEDASSISEWAEVQRKVLREILKCERELQCQSGVSGKAVPDKGSLNKERPVTKALKVSSCTRKFFS